MLTHLDINLKNKLNLKKKSKQIYKWREESGSFKNENQYNGISVVQQKPYKASVHCPILLELRYDSVTCFRQWNVQSTFQPSNFQVEAPKMP